MTERKLTAVPDLPKGGPVHGSLAEALAAFQAELPSVTKGQEAKIDSRRTGQSFAYSYADLADISDVALPLLGKHGLAWSCKPTVGLDGTFVLHYRLFHGASDQVDEGLWPLPSANIPFQEMGSAITYARRYALCAVTGIAPRDEDDDAASAPPPETEPRQARGKRAPANPPSPAIEQPKLSKDWAKLGDAATTYEALAAVHNEAQEKGELGLRVPNNEQTVDEYLRARKRTLLAEQEAPPEPATNDEAPMALAQPEAGDVPSSGWPTVEIPKSDPTEPGVES